MWRHTVHHCLKKTRVESRKHFSNLWFLWRSITHQLYFYLTYSVYSLTDLLWFRDHALEKSFRPATLTLQMEYTPLPVIDVNHLIPPEEFSRNYASRLRNLYPNEGKFQTSTCTRLKMASFQAKLVICTITLKSSNSFRRRKNVLKTSTGDQPSAMFLPL